MLLLSALRDQFLRRPMKAPFHERANGNTFQGD